ncbi:hypothetical protein ABN306_06990 [Providencia huaxiensis]|uniref:Arc family DNA-binding protein n=1 Tax=Providencia rettgeri TaxID=587 RepID=A0A9N8D1S7_PRORE|nr:MULTISPECIES: hypothetical protein [Providencia]ELR5176253.1 hypothetical protein [Providencia rettgeri]ELR5215900.1 hypothetical protein [Providencia rettgeri]ELR5294590.1 hypothetical protein [Providencia rettgeri]MBG5926152.1 hypothetical protein [Providencia rettgeri]MDI9092588.1 hypothetical protein [Providencia rettgeri]
MQKEITKQKLLRTPESLFWKIKEAAARSKRTENQEMLLRLEMSFDERVEKVIKECL